MAHWFNRFITQHNILELPIEQKDQLTENDMILYHISTNKVVTFKRINNKLLERYKSIKPMCSKVPIEQNMIANWSI